MQLTTGKIVELVFEKALETYENETQLLPLTAFKQPEAGAMQNSGNVIWRPRQQFRPTIAGWDMTGKETGIIEETYPAVLGIPENDIIQQRADDMRDTSFWETAGEESGRQQVTELNQAIADTIALQGSLFFRSNATSGYDFIGGAQAIMNERKGKKTTRNFMLNDRDNLSFASDLAARQTLQGRPADVWTNGQIGKNIAEFDVFTGSFLPNLVGGANPATTVTGNQTFAPTAGSVNATTRVVTNVDYRTADIPVAASAQYNVGDKVTIGDVQSVNVATKQATGQLMTFTIVGKPDGTTITVFPKPIAFDDAALSDLEKAYANINTTIANADTVDRLNIDASAKTNLFWDKGAVEVLGGTIPANLFSQFGGAKVVSKTMSNGQTMYMLYDGDIMTMNLTMRLFTWYGVTMADPSRAGVAISF